MGFVALIFALLIEQGRPLPPGNWIHRVFTTTADAVMRGTNAGERRHGVAGWLLVGGGALIALSILQWLLVQLHPLAVFTLHVAVLYYTVGFRQFSHPFTEIQIALATGDLEAARRVLQAWLRHDDPEYTVGDAPVPEICRLAISNAVVASHRHVFAPLFWYILLPGAIGPVLYRIAEMLARRWNQPGEVYGDFAVAAYRLLDWLPLRLSAAGFAIVGNFEDAVFAWRGAVATGGSLEQAAAESGAPIESRESTRARRQVEQRALLLATAGGALGLRIADPSLEAAWAQANDPGFEPPGGDPGLDGMRSAVGLVWRSVVLWVSLFAMITVANWLGR